MKITIENKEFEVLEYTSCEVIEQKYPGIASRGVVAMYTIKRKNRYYTVNQFKSGGFSKPLAAPCFF